MLDVLRKTFSDNYINAVKLTVFGQKINIACCVGFCTESRLMALADESDKPVG